MPERQGKPMQIAVCDDNPLFLKEISAQLEDLHIAERVNVFSCLHTFFLRWKKSIHTMSF